MPESMDPKGKKFPENILSNFIYYFYISESFAPNLALVANHRNSRFFTFK